MIPWLRKCRWICWRASQRTPFAIQSWRKMKIVTDQSGGSRGYLQPSTTKFDVTLFNCVFLKMFLFYLEVVGLRLAWTNPKSEPNFVTWQRCKHWTAEDGQTGSQVCVASSSQELRSIRGPWSRVINFGGWSELFDPPVDSGRTLIKPRAHRSAFKVIWNENTGQPWIDFHRTGRHLDSCQA